MLKNIFAINKNANVLKFTVIVFSLVGLFAYGLINQIYNSSVIIIGIASFILISLIGIILFFLGIEKLFFALIIAIPFDNFNIFSIFSVSDILLVIISLFFIFEMLLKKGELKWDRLNTALYLLLLWAGFSLFGSENIFKSIREMVTFAMIIVLVSLLKNIFFEKKQLLKISVPIITAGIVASVLGIVQFVAIYYFGSFLWRVVKIDAFMSNMRMYRINGTYFDPNFFALYLLTPLVFSLFVLFNSNRLSRGIRMLGWIGSLVILPVYVFTFSRMAWGILIIFILMFAVFKIRLNHYLKISYIALLCIAFIVVGGSILNFFISINYESFMERAGVLFQGINSMIEHPFNGVGLGSLIFNPYLGRKMETHNSYLQIGTQAGIPALLLFVFILFDISKKGLNILRRINNNGCVENVIYEALVWSFLLSLVGMAFLNAFFLKQFWIVVGLINSFACVFSIKTEQK